MGRRVYYSCISFNAPELEMGDEFRGRRMNSASRIHPGDESPWNTGTTLVIQTKIRLVRFLILFFSLAIERLLTLENVKNAQLIL